MFMLSIRLTKRRIILGSVLIAGLVMALLALTMLNGRRVDAAQESNAMTNADRCAFLEQFGWKVEATPLETSEVLIPQEFNEVYTPYNELQLAQGFDLRPYKGKVVTKFCYAVLNYPMENLIVANLLVYEGKIVGGDIDSPALGGFMHGFNQDIKVSGTVLQPWVY